MNFDHEFEVLGLLARFFKGGLQIPDMLKMTMKEVKFWYDIFEIQATTEDVIQKLSHDKNTGKEKKLPRSDKIREIVEEQIEDRRKQNGWQ